MQVKLRHLSAATLKQAEVSNDHITTQSLLETLGPAIHVYGSLTPPTNTIMLVPLALFLCCLCGPADYCVISCHMSIGWLIDVGCQSIHFVRAL